MADFKNSIINLLRDKRATDEVIMKVANHIGIISTAEDVMNILGVNGTFTPLITDFVTGNIKFGMWSEEGCVDLTHKEMLEYKGIGYALWCLRNYDARASSEFSRRWKFYIEAMLPIIMEEYNTSRNNLSRRHDQQIDENVINYYISSMPPTDRTIGRRIRMSNRPHQEKSENITKIWTDVSNYDINTESDCSICFSANSESIIITECNHKFHKNCLTEWMKHQKTCPICRNDIDIKNLKPKEKKLKIPKSKPITVVDDDEESEEIKTNNNYKIRKEVSKTKILKKSQKILKKKNKWGY